jgi:outer membrane protein TolC
MDSMLRPSPRLQVGLVLLMAILTGCAPSQPFYLHESGELPHYKDKAMEVEYPDSKEPHFTEAVQSHAPITISNPEIEELWDLTLQECVHIALGNSKLIRGSLSPRYQQGQIIPSFQEGVLTDNRGGPTIYDAAIQDSQVPTVGVSPNDFQLTNVGDQQGIGSIGTEAALSTFDADLNIFGSQGNNALFTTTDRPQNVTNTFSGFPSVLNLQNGGLITQLSKRTASGATFRVQNQTDSSFGNQRGSFQALQGFWTTIMEVGVTQPLLRNSGVAVNRAPIVIAAVAGHRQLAQTETALQKMVDNVEIRYWDLHRSYRDLETAKIARDTTQIAWRFIYERFRAGRDPAQSEAQAREQYFTFRAAVEQALRDLHNNENELRLLMGLSPADGRLIRPIDEPTLARVQFDWNEILAEALVKRPELRDQRWLIKTREVQMIVYRNQLLPTLDIGGFYRWVGLGDDLITANRRDLTFPQKGSTAFDSLLGGNFQEGGLTGVFNYTIGNRQALAGVRNYQLKLARDKAILEDMELDVSHSLARGIRNMDANYALAQSQFNRWVAADTEVKATQAVVAQGIGEGVQNINQWLDAIRRRGQAQQAYYQAICEYNKAIADVHMRKGSILEYNNIAFQEGPWAQKAYWDAMGLARQRDAALYLDYGYTRPNVISRGPMSRESLPGGGDFEMLPAEELPAPQAEPAETNDAREPEMGDTAAAIRPSATRPLITPAVGGIIRNREVAQSNAYWGNVELTGDASRVKTVTVAQASHQDTTDSDSNDTQASSADHQTARPSARRASPQRAEPR